LEVVQNRKGGQKVPMSLKGDFVFVGDGRKKPFDSPLGKGKVKKKAKIGDNGRGVVRRGGARGRSRILLLKIGTYSPGRGGGTYRTVGGRKSHKGKGIDLQNGECSLRGSGGKQLGIPG